MLQILTSLTLLSRVDLTAQQWILDSGATGTFVAMSGDSAVKPTAGGIAFPIWSESNRDQSAGFSPDIKATGKVSLMYGKLRGATDQFVGSPTVGAPLFVDANGKLTVTTAGSGVVVAYCTKAPNDTKYLSKTYSTIEFILV